MRCMICHASVIRSLKTEVALLVAIVFVSSFAMAEAMSNQDTHARDQWMQHWVTDSKSKVVPFSFEYGETPGAPALASWPRQATSRQLDATRKEYTLTWHDQRTGLEVRYVVVEYSDFPVVEWTVYFANKGDCRHSDIDEHPGPRYRIAFSPQRQIQSALY